MYERINTRGMISGAIMIVLALAMTLANEPVKVTLLFVNPLFYIGGAVLLYNFITPRMKRAKRSSPQAPSSPNKN